MTDYALSEAGWENEEHRYPKDKPWVLRDQGVRRWDETIKVVLDDVCDVLKEQIATFESVLRIAENLCREADDLDEDDEWYADSLNDILQEAEQLDHIRINWDGDAGMVSVSISDYWYEVEDDSGEEG